MAFCYRGGRCCDCDCCAKSTWKVQAAGIQGTNCANLNALYVFDMRQSEALESGREACIRRLILPPVAVGPWQFYPQLVVTHRCIEEYVREISFKLGGAWWRFTDSSQEKFNCAALIDANYPLTLFQLDPGLCSDNPNPTAVLVA